MAHLAQTLEEIEPEVEVEEDNVNDRSFQLQPKSFTEIKLASISHHAKQVDFTHLTWHNFLLLSFSLTAKI